MFGTLITLVAGAYLGARNKEISAFFKTWAEGLKERGEDLSSFLDRLAVKEDAEAGMIHIMLKDSSDRGSDAKILRSFKVRKDDK